MNAQTLLAAVGLITAAAALHRRYKRREQSPQYYDTAQLADAIKALYALTERLQNADTMIADLNACNPQALLRCFHAQWCGIDGKRREIEFFADGRNSATAGLLAAAQEQREELNAEIIDTIRALAAALDAGEAPALEVYAVGETVDETKAGELARGCGS